MFEEAGDFQGQEQRPQRVRQRRGEEMKVTLLASHTPQQKQCWERLWSRSQEPLRQMVRKKEGPDMVLLLLTQQKEDISSIFSVGFFF